MRAVVAVSDEVKQRLLKAGVREDKIHLVRNGIDLRPFDNAQPSLRSGPQANRPAIVGLVGRLSIEKGVDIFLRAAARVLAELPSTKFVVVGEGPDRDKLESLIDDLKIRGSVSMLGRRDDMPSVYASLDIMVSASRQEGLPIAILEGMASRLPLVATAVGEVPTVVLDGRTGVLLPPRGPAVTGVCNRGPAAEPRRTGASWSHGKKAHRRQVLRRPNDGRLSPRVRRRVGQGNDKVNQLRRGPRVFMMDLWATVPYYTAYLSRALLAEHVDLTVGSISYYLDPTCFSSRGIKTRPGRFSMS